MNVLLLDTNVVSILFNRNHSLRQASMDAVAERQLAISFMTRAELMLWPVANELGRCPSRRSVQHLNPYTTIYPDEYTCAIWVEVVDQCRRAEDPDGAWIASTARQWASRW